VEWGRGRHIYRARIFHTETKRNSVFLATTDGALLQAAAVIRLWEAGFVEPLKPPSFPINIVAQQLLTIALERNGISASEFIDTLSGFLEKAGVSSDEVASLVAAMRSAGWIDETDGRLWFAKRVGQKFEWGSYLRLFPTFVTPVVVSVFHGSSEIGTVDERLFSGAPIAFRISSWPGGVGK
jgi:ATP-dependent helicase Lhr and Lhr-like helicase